MQTDHVGDDRLPEPPSDVPGTPDMSPGVEHATFTVLRTLLTLPPDAARQVREATPRRRPRRPQHGPTADLGEDRTDG